MLALPTLSILGTFSFFAFEEEKQSANGKQSPLGITYTKHFNNRDIFQMRNTIVGQVNWNMCVTRNHVPRSKTGNTASHSKTYDRALSLCSGHAALSHPHQQSPAPPCFCELAFQTSDIGSFCSEEF